MYFLQYETYTASLPQEPKSSLSYNNWGFIIISTIFHLQEFFP